MDEQILNNLSMRIIYYKKKFKLTNDIIAERSGLPVTTISRITSGQTKSPKLENVRKIAEAIGCTLNDLISETFKNFTWCKQKFKTWRFKSSDWYSK